MPLKIFLSWNGVRSKAMAEALRDWLSLALHYAHPSCSQEISSGQVWVFELKKRLEECKVGILCITKENTESPWICFEAGAISKTFNDSLVIPLLLDLEISDLSSKLPYSHYQVRKTERESMMQVLTDLNAVAEDQIPERRLHELFEMSWPKLEANLAQARAKLPDSSETSISHRDQRAILEDLVGEIRGFEKRLRDIGPGTSSGVTLDKLGQNQFLENAIEGLRNYRILFDRVDENKGLKSELSKFFWLYCFSGIARSQPHVSHIFFESGSTLAYVADSFLSQMEENPYWKKNFLSNIGITTNNLLVYMEYLFTDLAPNLVMTPQGRPDKRYGATYGTLEGLDSYDPPFDSPLPTEAKECIKDLASQLLTVDARKSNSDIHSANLLVLASSSGINCDKPLGPHVGSYRNMLFKRALLQTGAPIVFFVDESKFAQESYDPNRCFLVCAQEFEWKTIVKTQPMAFCVGASNAERAKEIVRKLMKIEITKSSPPKPRGKFIDCHPFIAANEAFANLFPSIPLELSESRWGF